MTVSNVLKLAVFACIALASAGLGSAQKGQGADGNPHGWDRKRRCDHAGYTPKCGLCEGYGGIPYGDENDQITLTTCEPVANASDIDPKTLKRPIWARTFSTHSWEVLIGKKTDPFCFQTFPGNSSEGALCYRPQTGVQTYEFQKARAIREDLTLKTPVGNITTTVLHQGRNFWVVNKLPWYAAGVHQCICTQAHEGADKSKPGVFPIQTNWTDNLFFVGREKIGVEYDQGVKVLDHWAFGPHHVWSFPESGQILRMWQPFNGLQVFPEGANPTPVNETLFSEIPPPLCKKKGGATFRIKCTDDGYPQDAKPSAEIAQHEIETKTSRHSDISRAKTKVPRQSYRGKNFGHMSEKLNAVLLRDSLINTRKCSDWPAEEIQALQARLFLLRDGIFQNIYHGAQDNRRLRGDLNKLQTRWNELHERINTAKKASPAMAQVAHDVMRDGHCHEAVMWYVHHLTADVKAAIKGIELPLLSEAHHGEDGGACSEGALARNYWSDPTGALTQACQVYEEKVTCASCHSDAA